MTRGFLSLFTMRPNHCWTVLHVSMLMGLILTLNSEGEESNCEVEIRVHRHTVYNVFHGQDLTVTCPVAFCNSSPPTVSWYKMEKTDILVSLNSSSHIKVEWEDLGHLGGQSLLIFQKIHRSDSGVYQCRTERQVSHNINVSVNAIGDPDNTTMKNEISTTSFTPKPSENLWLYVYSGAGIVVFVIIVIVISIITMRGCKGKSKKEPENQYAAIPMVEHASRPPPQRGSPSGPPSRRSTQRKTPPSQPHELTSPRDNKYVYAKTTEDRQRQRNAVTEEDSSIVYAALNHQLPAGATARPQRPQEECSEYAAIRVS
ncbi:B- and T-lymphocyte attenuator-like [Mastacembelus armatus]|uniref:B- and T-lymphocyte attenuator-like n=1 Tax=Mastacembelus armatus TaxID=205130 RepID=A0A3Q3N8G8_9TELE|nr:B- and T-lymphocyte attenuator-like [Mastacembelus armatus]